LDIEAFEYGNRKTQGDCDGNRAGPGSSSIGHVAHPVLLLLFLLDGASYG
jgi:hypothetical protein